MMLTVLVASALLVQAPTAVEVPFRIGEDAIIVDAVVNGRKATFMFDTGFSGSLVLNDALNIGAATGTMNLRDFVGQFEARTVPLRSLSIGAAKVNTTDMDVVQQPLAHMSASYNTHTDGIMGLEVMKDFVLEINVERKKFVLHPRSMDITKRQPDGKRTFLAKMLPIGHNSVEMQVVTPSGQKMTLALDTGNAFFAATHKDVLERVGLWKAGRPVKYMRQSWVASGPVDSFYKQMPLLEIYGVPVPSSVWSIIDAPSSSAEGDGTIGFGFLRNFNVIVDMERRRVWMENFTGTTGNTMPADVGITAAFDDRQKRVRIYRVTPDSPAEKAGIKVGDALLAVDGQQLLDLGDRRLFRLFEGEKGSTVKVSISRDGVLRQVDLVRELLVNAVE